MARFKFDNSGLKKMVKDIENFTFEVECPNCKRPISVSINDLVHTVICPCCSSSIKIESE